MRLGNNRDADDGERDSGRETGGGGEAEPGGVRRMAMDPEQRIESGCKCADADKMVRHRDEHDEQSEVRQAGEQEKVERRDRDEQNRAAQERDGDERARRRGLLRSGACALHDQHTRDQQQQRAGGRRDEEQRPHQPRRDEMKTEEGASAEEAGGVMRARRPAIHAPRVLRRLEVVKALRRNVARVALMLSA